MTTHFAKIFGKFFSSSVLYQKYLSCNYLMFNQIFK